MLTSIDGIKYPLHRINRMRKPNRLVIEYAFYKVDRHTGAYSLVSTNKCKCPMRTKDYKALTRMLSQDDNLRSTGVTSLESFKLYHPECFRKLNLVD